jgi:hypothetical protein
MGSVQLCPGLLIGDTEPSTLPIIPYVMTDFTLVMSSNYRFSYNQYRYVEFGYLLTRDSGTGDFIVEYGEFHVLSKAKYNPAIDPNSYSLPYLLTGQQKLVTDNNIGVELGVLTDETTLNTDPQWGISYRITTATPLYFPYLRMFITKMLPT